MNSITIFFKSMTLSKYVLLFCSPLIIIILSMQNIILTLLGIIIIDLITGVRKSHHKVGVGFYPWKKEFWDVIKSSQLRRSWKKTSDYFLLIFISIALQILLFKGFKIEGMGLSFTLSEMIGSMACVIEIYSIYENLEAVSGRNPLKRIVSFLPPKIKEYFKRDEENK